MKTLINKRKQSNKHGPWHRTIRTNMILLLIGIATLGTLSTLATGCDEKKPSERKSAPPTEKVVGNETSPTTAPSPSATQPVDAQDDPDYPRALPHSGDVLDWTKTQPIRIATGQHNQHGPSSQPNQELQHSQSGQHSSGQHSQHSQQIAELVSDPAVARVLEAYRTERVSTCSYACPTATADVLMVEAATPADAFGIFHMLASPTNYSTAPDNSLRSVQKSGQKSDRSVIMTACQGKVWLRFVCSIDEDATAAKLKEAEDRLKEAVKGTVTGAVDTDAHAEPPGDSPAVKVAARPKPAVGLQACQRLFDRTVFGVMAAEPPLLVQAVQDVNTKSCKVWLVRSAALLTSLPEPVLRELDPATLNDRLGLTGNATLTVVAIQLAPDAAKTSATQPTADAKANTNSVAQTKSSVQAEPLASPLTSPPTLILWMAEYPNAATATASADRYIEALKTSTNDFDKRTAVLPAKGKVVVGTWTANKDGQNLLKMLGQSLPE